MHILQICNHTQKQNFTLFSLQSNNNDNRAISYHIISIFLDVDTLTSQILSTPSTPIENAEMTNPRKLQPSTLHGSKATKKILLVLLLQKVKFKRCLLIC